MMNGNYLLTVFVFLNCLISPGMAQLNQRPKIYSLHVKSDIQFRFATTLVTSRVANPANYSQETVFEVILPEEAFISNFTIEIGGKIYPGIVKDKEAARKDYIKAKKKGQTTGLVSQKPRDSRTFKVKVNLAGLSKSTFNLTYQELLKRVRGAYEHRIFIKPGYPVDDIQVSVAIQESRDITSLTVPPIKNLNKLLTGNTDVTENPLAVITRPTKRSAYISYSPRLSDQGADGLAGKFEVYYDIDRSLDGGDILVVNGYFVHFLAPDVPRSIPKDVLFILDVSGSMHGRKIDQLKDAMYIVLDELREGDRFNIMTFSGRIKSYSNMSQMIDVTQNEILLAKKYVKEIRTGGWTDINSAILDGLESLIESKLEGERSPVVVFLTDGQPSSGVQNPDTILANIQQVNEGEIPVFSLAFGKAAAWSLVKKMALQNDGVGRKIYEDSDADLQISGFYDELAVTLLNNVTVKYLDDTVDETSLTKSEFKNYFRGSEMVVTGKLTDAGAPTVDLEIFSNSVDGDLVLTVDKGSNFIDVSDVESRMGLTDFQTITEKTWAYLTIKQLLRQADGETNKTAVEQLKERAKELSLKYGFVTPLTSMVVTKPEVESNDVKTPAVDDGKMPSRPTPANRGGSRYSADNDPHFIVNVRGLDTAICFDVMGSEGEVYRLLSDSYIDLTVDAKVASNKRTKHVTKVSQLRQNEAKTFISEVRMKRGKFNLEVFPTTLKIGDITMAWLNGISYTVEEAKVSVDERTITVKFNDRVTLLVMRHLQTKSMLRAGKINFLGFYIVNSGGLSYGSRGILGQFLHKRILLKKTKQRNGKTIGQLRVMSDAFGPRNVMATLGQRVDIARNETVSCWMVTHTGDALLDGNLADYLVKTNKTE